MWWMGAINHFYWRAEQPMQHTAIKKGEGILRVHLFPHKVTFHISLGFSNSSNWLAYCVGLERWAGLWQRGVWTHLHSGLKQSQEHTGSRPFTERKGAGSWGPVSVHSKGPSTSQPPYPRPTWSINPTYRHIKHAPPFQKTNLKPSLSLWLPLNPLFWLALGDTWLMDQALLPLVSAHCLSDF